MECHGFEAGYVEGRQRPLGFDAEAPARSYSRLETSYVAREGAKLASEAYLKHM